MINWQKNYNIAVSLLTLKRKQIKEGYSKSRTGVNELRVVTRSRELALMNFELVTRSRELALMNFEEKMGVVGEKIGVVGQKVGVAYNSKFVTSSYNSNISCSPLITIQCIKMIFDLHM